MSERDSQTKLLLLMAMLALWAAAWGYSVVYFITTDISGDGFTRGLNRFTGFLGWQGVAGLFAVACWGVGRGFPKRSGTRHVSAVPMGMALALALILIGAVVYSRMATS